MGPRRVDQKKLPFEPVVQLDWFATATPPSARVIGESAANPVPSSVTFVPTVPFDGATIITLGSTTKLADAPVFRTTLTESAYSSATNTFPVAGPYTTAIG